MKPALIVVFLVLVFVATAAAQQTNPSQTPVPESQASGPAAESQPQVRSSITPRLSPEQQQELRQRVQSLSFELPSTAFSNVCYTMNSFVFARNNGGDAVRLVAQRTCTPAAKFRVKKATVTVATPGR